MEIEFLFKFRLAVERVIIFISENKSGICEPLLLSFMSLLDHPQFNLLESFKFQKYFNLNNYLELKEKNPDFNFELII